MLKTWTGSVEQTVTDSLCSPYCFYAAHVMEEERDAGAGVEFLTETRDDWKTSVFGGHLVWHLTLYYVGEL